MDKKNTPKENKPKPIQNYDPRRDCGDMTEDEALEAHRQGKMNDAWNNDVINRLYNPNR